MKKLFALVFLAVATLSSNAATITIAPGFSNQITVTLDGIAVPGTFHVAIGSWNGSAFTQFASGYQDSGTINGSVVGTSPTAGINGAVIHVYVGIGNAVNTGPEGNWVLLKSGANTAFPTDVSSTSASATFHMNNASPNVVNFVAGSAGNSLQGNIVRLVPEPSTALLGLLGIAGLLRRRR